MIFDLQAEQVEQAWLTASELISLSRVNLCGKADSYDLSGYSSEPPLI